MRPYLKCYVTNATPTVKIDITKYTFNQKLSTEIQLKLGVDDHTEFHNRRQTSKCGVEICTRSKKSMIVHLPDRQVSKTPCRVNE